MYETKNPLSAISYTNKDFQSIYEELLEVTKNLAKNWDPTISNESDPGVVLLKLNAIIGDKNNYNIDKNVLENYPETYTQEFSARSQYRQLGYKMPWYRAATTDITLKWVGEKFLEGDSLTISKYTMVSDSDKQIVYTLLRDVSLGKTKSASDSATVPAIQGIITTLNIAGSSKITLSHLDSRNRLYIKDKYIAENGIFVSYASTANNIPWTQVDNVEVQSSKVRCYEFDIDPMNGYPFLQFPDDVRDLIGDGLTVKYIITNGLSGNVSAKTINKFYNESSTTLSSMENGDKPIALKDDNIRLYNVSGTTNGRDPETIEEAYKSFKHVVGTFDTLVTLRDYMNAVYNSGIVSNVIVTDRTNDIQSTYRIVDKDKSSILGYVDYQTTDDSKVSYVKIDEAYYLKHSGETFYKSGENGTLEKADTPLDFNKNNYYVVCYDKHMNAFNLKFYLLKCGGELNSLADYNKTFEIDNSDTTYTHINTYLDRLKSIQHDRKDIQPYVPFMLQNVYPIKLKIAPTIKLSEDQQMEVTSNILTSLIKLLNSRKCEFGEEPSYDLIYNEIASCDERIKVVIMDDFVYTTYAVYLDSEASPSSPEFKYIPISDYSSSESIIVRSKSDVDNSDGAPNPDYIGEIRKSLKAAAVSLRKEKGLPDDELKNLLFIDSTNGIAYKVNIKSTDDIDLVVYSNKLNKIRTEIIARNILAGVTPLYDQNDSFNISMNMNVKPELSGPTETVTTEIKIAPFGLTTDFDPNTRGADYTLKDNESIRLYAPSFITDATYSNYVKFELVMASPTTDTAKYVLADPKEEERLRSLYGDAGFYSRVGSGGSTTYKVITSHQYEKFEESAPIFKYGHHYKAYEKGSGLAYKLLGSLKPISGDVTPVISNRRYIPKFEPNMYYAREQGCGRPIYRLLKNAPEDWTATYHEKYYMRRIEWKSPRLLSDSWTGDDAGSYSCPVWDPAETYYEYDVSYYVCPRPSGKTWKYPIYRKHTVKTMNDEGEESTKEWYIEITSSEELDNLDPSEDVYERDARFLGEVSSEAVADGWDTKWYNYAKMVDWCGLGLHNDNCFVKLGTYLTYVICEKSGTDNNGTPVTHKTLLTCNANYDPENGTTYSEFEAPDTWNDHYKSFYVKSLSESGLTMNSVKSIVPQYVPDKVYARSESGGDVVYSPVSVYPLQWSDKFMEYYKKVSEEFPGLNRNSTEAEEWRNGKRSLYVREMTYSIPANTEYQLKEGDYITFFYRESNENDAPYRYVKYNHIYDKDTDTPTVIKSNFTIHASTYDRCKINPQSLGPSGLIQPDGINSRFKIINEDMYGDYDLSGTRKIEMRKINHVKLDSDKNKFYYIISTSTETKNDGDYFIMDLKRSDTKSGKKRYVHTLQNDEYFVYTNRDKSLFEVLASGTMIEYYPSESNTGLDDKTVRLSNKCVDIERIMYHGIDAFADQCKLVKTGDVFKLVEQQIYALTSGDTVHVELDDSFGYQCSQVKAEEEYDDTKVYFIKECKYRLLQSSVDATGEAIIPPFVKNRYYELVGNVYRALADKPNGWGEPSAQYYTSLGDYFTAVSKDKINDADEFNKLNKERNLYSSPVPVYPVFKSSENTVLTDFTVSYRSGDSAYTDLPRIKVSNGDYGWQATASLNLKIDKGSSQKIVPSDGYASRKITINEKSYPSDTNDTAPLFLMSDTPLDKIGGPNIDVTYSTLANVRRKINLLAYHDLLESNEDKNWVSLGDGFLGVNIPKGKSDVVYTLSGIELDGQYKYILSIENPSDKMKIRLWAKKKVDGEVDEEFEKLYCMCHGEDIVGTGRHYYKLPVDTIELRVGVVSGHAPDVDSTVLVHPLFKYNERDMFNEGKGPKYSITTTDLETKIWDMDKVKKFDYTHIPSDDVLIKDPLNPQSLFDTNHVYNKFTLSKAMLNGYKLGGFSTIFVNNR